MSTKKLTILNKGLLPGEKNRDKFREIIGTWTHSNGNIFWTQKNKKIEINALSTEKDIEPNLIWNSADNLVTGVNILADGENFHHLTQKFEIGYPYSDDIGLDIVEDTADHIRFKRILEQMKENLVFEDFASQARVPVSDFGPNQDKTAGGSYEYNYLDIAYERVLNQGRTKHIQIPSMYALAAEANSNTLEENSLSAPTVKRLIINKSKPRSRRKFKNQMVVGNPSKTIGTWEDSKELFPMYSEIRVPTGRNKRISTDLQDTDLAAIFMRDIIEEQNLESRKSAGVSVFMERNTGKTIKFNLKSDSIDLLDYWVSDIGAWGGEPPPLPKTSMFISAAGENTAEQSSVFAGPDNITIQESLADQKGSSFVMTIPFATGVETLRGKLDLILEDHVRGYSKLTRGEPAYSEMVMYKISKYVEDARAPIQEFYFYNAGETADDVEKRIVSFIDTQVRYNEEYRYDVSAYLAVVGSKYYYKGLKESVASMEYRDGKIWTTFKVVTMPTVRLFEVPVFSTTGRIVAPPPYYPQSHIEQIKGMSRGMLFSFDTQVGETYEQPISFNTLEEKINDQFLRDDKKSSDGKVLYRTTSAISGVQVFRIEDRPEDYFDFQGNLLRTISTDDDLASDLSAGSVAKVIMQAPNRKFYYMFRSLGFHGETSNPSPVYEVELFNDGGVAYPIVRVYEFKE